MAGIQTTISPYTQKPVTTRQTLTSQELNRIIERALVAQNQWQRIILKERIKVVKQWLEEFEKQKENICDKLCEEMSRPRKQCGGEINGTLQRARHLVKIAPDCLKVTTQLETETPGLKLAIQRAALGIVVLISPWNYPFLVTVNTLVAAILAGNTVILKPSPQTPSAAEFFESTFKAAGMPPYIIQTVHLEPPRVAQLVADPRIAYVSFTGSVAGGKAIDQAAANAPIGFKTVGLELGGKDPAYVRADADLQWAAEELVDGAMFNSGQSCCSIERIYVHDSVFDQFVKKFVKIASAYKLGDPSDPQTTLGPVISLASAERIRKQIEDAKSKGAKSLLEDNLFPEAKQGTTMVAPTVLVNVNHTMDIMTEETFGPAIGIQSVSGDQEALSLMNDSKYGLTASIWTNAEDEESMKKFDEMATNLTTGTVFLNRADALDPALAWAGVKDSGRGVSLSSYGFDQVTRPRSIHIRYRKG